MFLKFVKQTWLHEVELSQSLYIQHFWVKFQLPCLSCIRNKLSVTNLSQNDKSSFEQPGIITSRSFTLWSFWLFGEMREAFKNIETLYFWRKNKEHILHITFAEGATKTFDVQLVYIILKVQSIFSTCWWTKLTASCVEYLKYLNQIKTSWSRALKSYNLDRQYRFGRLLSLKCAKTYGIKWCSVIFQPIASENKTKRHVLCFSLSSLQYLLH